MHADCVKSRKITLIHSVWFLRKRRKRKQTNKQTNKQTKNNPNFWNFNWFIHMGFFFFFRKLKSQLSRIRILESDQVNCLHPLCEKKQTQNKVSFHFPRVSHRPIRQLIETHNLKGNPEKIDQMWTYIQAQRDWTRSGSLAD